MAKLQVSIDEQAQELVIRLPIVRTVSKSGKSLVIASTNGNKQVDVEVDGKKLTVGVNAYVPREAA